MVNKTNSSCLEIKLIYLVVSDKRNKPESVDCTPPDAIIPSSKERPLLPLHPGMKDLKVRSVFSQEIVSIFYTFLPETWRSSLKE